ncbi:MAG TPA: peptidylprolyl isomerase [Fimbriimonas sp.]|nr:peptidylprolyl isomerase [Fimbriimonas sp.]
MKLWHFAPLLLLAGGCTDNSQAPVVDPKLQDSYSSLAPNTPPATEEPLEDPKFAEPKAGEEVAVISTKFGKIVFKFRPDKAPKHKENFISLANKGFYDKTIFHRIIPDFMIQGGDPETKDPKNVAAYGSGGPGYNVANEFNNLNHLRGVVSMARSQDVNSAGSQFYIVVKDSAHLNRNYTAFGEVVSGMDVADKIKDQPRNENDLPNERIEMTVKIQKWPVK